MGKGILKSKSVARLTLKEQDKLTLFPLDYIDNHDLEESVVTSAYYGNSMEKDNFVKDVYEFDSGKFDGIAFYSNQDKKHVCYALFDRGVAKIKELVDLKQVEHFSSTVLSNDPRALFAVTVAFKNVVLENPSN